MSLEQLQHALDTGRVAELRRILADLTAEERELLKAEVGDESYDGIFTAAARRARGPKRGRVILLHGIMGADLDVKIGRDRDRVWIHYWRLFNGRIKDLRLDVDSSPSNPHAHVVIRGQNKKYYLPPLLELDNHWHAIPFAYDWRLDIRRSADRLAELVTSFGEGEPVHLVAHSMGGLVSRAFILRHPALWERCCDPNGCRSGGRLVMLGTPNHGSYTIPLVLTGQESKVKSLAFIDRKHGPKQLLRIINTFPGSYQMLPSPFEASVDERKKLYDTATWGTLPIVARHLDDAHRFHDSLRPVVDEERFVYVAGTNQRTPSAVRIDGPGKLSYAHTDAGDGRVTHELGRLPGVKTYYVRQAHGNLPIDKDVLASIHELLATGVTTGLDTRSTARRRDTLEFEDAAETIPVELRTLVETDARRRGKPRRSSLSDADQRRVQALLMDDPAVISSAERKRGAGKPARVARRKQGKPATLRIDVVWGDVTEVRADLYAVGHYEGVLPQYAERALDVALSGTKDPEEQVLRQHTIRGHLRGALGDVDLFPWPGSSKSRAIAVAGMGVPGTFTPQALRFLVQKLVWVVASVPRAETIATVLIGSGAGTLTVREATRSYLQGIRDAFKQGDVAGRDYRLRFVELYRHRAEQIRDALREAEDAGLVADLPTLDIRGSIGRTQGRRISTSDAFRTIARVVAEDSARGTARKHLDALLRSVKRKEPNLADPLDESIRHLIARGGPSAPTPGTQGRERGEPTRMSFTRDKDGVRVAAISSATTVSERILRFDPTLLEELVEETGEHEEASVSLLSSFVTRLLMPSEFRDWIATKRGPFVFEVDREMARVHWEMISSDGVGGAAAEPLAQRAVVSRQLRTTYSAPPTQPVKRHGPLRVLVVGDPGDPQTGDDLPGAEEEALEIVRLMRGLPNVEVESRIGSPRKRRTGPLRTHASARRLDVLRELVTGDYDILHYCGHGDFDPAGGDRAGWVFTEGLLTSREIERIENPPPLVVANACLSARTSRAKGSNSRRRLESTLLPSLADEFFRRGVRNYVGTAWTVSDVGAVLFAETLYSGLLGGSATIGEAVREARRALYLKRDVFGGLWSAYQHYGDPNTAMDR